MTGEEYRNARPDIGRADVVFPENVGEMTSVKNRSPRPEASSDAILLAAYKKRPAQARAWCRS
jgi:hypothetical protein